MSLLGKLFSATQIVALQKITQAITGLGTALMVAHFLSPEEQGYFYTMGSLLSSYIIFDLGLSSYLLQRSAQLSHGLTIAKDGTIYPGGGKRDEFLTFLQWTFNWYRNTGAIAMFILLPVGIWVLSQNIGEKDASDWVLPWLLISGAIAVNMPTIGLLAVLEGSGRVSETYLIRTAHYALGAALAWCAIALGHGLYAQAFPIIATAFACYSWFLYRYRHILRKTNQTKISNPRNLILGQLKYTASIWLTNYIFLNAPVILSFIYGEVVSSGQLGLSIIIANVGGAIAMSSFTAKLPLMITNMGSGNYPAATKELQFALKKFFKIYASGSLAIILLKYNTDFLSRILEIDELIILLIAFASFHASNAIILYLRACGKNTSNYTILIFSTFIFVMTKQLGMTEISGIYAGMITFSCSILATSIISLNKINKIRIQ